MTEPTDCYDVPQYWDLAFDDDTEQEADFIEAVTKKYCDFPLKSLYEPGCGGGRLIVELTRRGYSVSGADLSEQAVQYANTRLVADGHDATVSVGDMRTFQPSESVDVVYCLVNTFRHLQTEEDALQHLQSAVAALRPGGLYVLGMHLLPPDADEEDEEAWAVTQKDTTVHMQLTVDGCDRETRLETLQFEMEVVSPEHPQPLKFASDYLMRIYEAEQMTALLAQVPELHLADVYDFWYDIEEPLTLSDEMGDTVFILQKSFS